MFIISGNVRKFVLNLFFSIVSNLRTSNTPNQARVGSPNSQLPQVHMKTGQKLHVNLLEREAAEGSETEVQRRSSASPRNASDGRGGPTGPQSPIPLDQLLSQADEEGK